MEWIGIGLLVAFVLILFLERRRMIGFKLPGGIEVKFKAVATKKNADVTSIGIPSLGKKTKSTR